MGSPGQGNSKCNEGCLPVPWGLVQVLWGWGSDFLYERLKPKGRESQGLICVFKESLWFLSGS